MDDFEKLVVLPVEEAQGAGLPKSLAEAKEIGSPRYFTGKPCKWGHVAERFTPNKVCAECSRQYNDCPKRKEANRLCMRKYNAIPENKEAIRKYRNTKTYKTYVRLRSMAKTNDALLFAINQVEMAAVRGQTYSDIVTQCPEPQRTQLQSLIYRIRADPKAGKAVIALLRTMRELRKTELAEAKNEAR
jgi:hypothetical protein